MMNKREHAPEFEKWLGGYPNKEGLIRSLRVCVCTRAHVCFTA